jgi:uncharacterized membrane protein
VEEGRGCVTVSESKWKQLLSSKYINWLIAKNRIERKYFWIRFITLSILIIILAHNPYIGWSVERYIAIPEESAWDLNPILWPPYYLTGHTHVRNDMYKGYWDPIIPPLQYISLYLLSLIYWLFIAFLISKLFTWNKFKNERLPTNKGDTAEYN